MLHFVGSDDVRVGAAIRHILIAVECSELNDAELLIDHLPADSYGQVYIEAEDESEYLSLNLPRRVTANWLYRSQTFSASLGEAVEAGSLVAEAARVWIGEFLVEDERGSINGVAAWLGSPSEALTESISSAIVQRIQQVSG